MEIELKKYLLEQCRAWMLPEEIKTLNRLGLTEHGESVTKKTALVEYKMELSFGFKDEKVNNLVSLGQKLAEESIAERLLKDNPAILNNCSKCGKLARTLKARQCRHCDNKWFDEENIKTPFNEEFCTQLESRICLELEKSTDSELKGFWCDGISWFPTEKQLTKKHVNDKRRIETIAWIGKTGQTEFQAIINFGQKALRKYTKEMNLTDCIPSLESKAEWIEIDLDSKTIKIELH